MREFTKSIFSFSWALSLFGIQQTANLLSPDKVATAFDSVTHATEEQICGGLKTTFDAGDKLQRNAVNFMCGFLSGEMLNPSRMMRMTTDVARASMDAVTQSAQGMTSTLRQTTSAVTQQNPRMETPPGAGAASVEEPQSWGPIPSRN